MKKLTKTIINIIAFVMLVVGTVGMSACEDIKSIKLNLNLYNYTDLKYYSSDKVDFDINLYRHLAPKTVDKVISYINSGYYDNTIFYTTSDSDYELIMVGDLKMDEDGNIVQNLIDGKLPSQMYGEFTKNGTKGSNLKCETGSVGIFRSYYENDVSFEASSSARDSGRATMFLPQGSFSAYNDNFCFFGKYNTDNAETKLAIDEIASILESSTSFDCYVVYYTGTYDQNSADLNHGLTFHCIDEESFNTLKEEGIDNLFYAEGEQLVSYNYTKIHVAKVLTKDGVKSSTASIKSIELK